MDESYGNYYKQLYARHWWWRSRETILAGEIRRLALPDAGVILDVGCGDGLFFPFLSTLGNVEGIETDEKLLDPNGPVRSRISTAPLGSPEYNGKKYKLITALDVIEHIEDDRTAMLQLYSMLAPGGYLVITVPAMMALWDEHDAINRHFRRYDIDALTRLVPANGRILKTRLFFHFVAMAKRLVALLNKKRARKIAQHAIPQPWVNGLMRFLCVLEFRVSDRLRFPVGSSILLIVQKPADPVLPSR